MAIKINSTNLYKRIINNKEAEKVILNQAQIWPTEIPADLNNYLYFEAATIEWCEVKLRKRYYANNTYQEISYDKFTWSDYTFWTTISLNFWERVYFRNKSTTPTPFSNPDQYSNYHFEITGSTYAGGDIGYLLCKNSTTDLSGLWWGCFWGLFSECYDLLTTPELPATTLEQECYEVMFANCTSLTTVPQLPATTVPHLCYSNMFYGCTSLNTLPTLPSLALQGECYQGMFRNCTNIKLSTTQTWEYQTPYRIPTTWTWTAQSYALSDMFISTWWTFTWTPTVNTTYYTSNTVV